MAEKPTISASKAIKDIRAGLSDAQIMAKYSLSSRGLQSLLSKLVAMSLITQADLDNRNKKGSKSSQGQISARQIVADIKSGMSDLNLMTKHDLSPQRLDNLFAKLLKAEYITQADLDRRQAPMNVEGTVDLSAESACALDPKEAYQDIDDISAQRYTCPSCRYTQDEAFENCPECGISVKAFQEVVERARWRAQNKQEAPTEPPSEPKILFQNSPIMTQRLITAAGGGNLSKVKELIEGGININRQDSDGMTPLIAACRDNQVEVVKLLLEKGANPNLKTSQGADAWYAAKCRGHNDILDLIMKYTKGTPYWITRESRDGKQVHNEQPSTGTSLPFLITCGLAGIMTLVILGLYAYHLEVSKDNVKITTTPKLCKVVRAEVKTVEGEVGWNGFRGFVFCREHLMAVTDSSSAEAIWAEIDAYRDALEHCYPTARGEACDAARKLKKRLDKLCPW